MSEKKSITRHSNFVAADSPPRVTVLPPAELPPAPIAEQMPYSSHSDRALGFTLATLPLAGATAFVVLCIAIVAFGVPLLSTLALLVALGGFAFVWLIAYIAHTFISHEGSLFLHVLLAWRYLKREQKERHKRYGRHD